MGKIVTSAETRRDEIYELMKEQKKIRVADIMKQFGVSSVTANNDLIHLERKGLINKEFGYAIIRDAKLNLFDETHVANLDKKKELGRYAAGLLEEGESIFIYTGSTTHQISKYIQEGLGLIVVTNSILTANELGKNKKINIILLGGFYNPEVYATYGGQSIKQLEEYNINKLFISANGIDSEYGITIDEPFEAELNKALIKNAQKVIVLADSTKIGKRRFIAVADMSQIDILITNKDADEKALKYIRDMGVKVELI